MELNIREIKKLFSKIVYNINKAVETDYEQCFLDKIEKQFDDIETILYYTNIKALTKTDFYIFTDIMDIIEDIYDNLKLNKHDEENLTMLNKKIEIFDKTFKNFTCIIEEKNLKVTFNKSGAGNITPRLTLPTAWVKWLGLDKDNRVIKATFDGNKIIIEKDKKGDKQNGTK